MDAFVIPAMVPATRYFEYLTKTIGWVFFHRLLQSLNYGIVSGGIGSIAIEGIANAYGGLYSFFLHYILQYFVVEAEIGIHLL